jgi:hypothetical protein
MCTPESVKKLSGVAQEVGVFACCFRLRKEHSITAGDQVGGLLRELIRSRDLEHHLTGLDGSDSSWRPVGADPCVGDQGVDDCSGIPGRDIASQQEGRPVGQIPREPPGVPLGGEGASQFIWESPALDNHRQPGSDDQNAHERREDANRNPSTLGFKIRGRITKRLQVYRRSRHNLHV